MWRIVIIFAVVLGIRAQETYRLEIKPLDLQSDDVEFFLSGLNQIQSDGKRYYLCSPTNTEIGVVDGTGRVLATMGGRGGHPSEFGDHGVLSISIQGERLWAIDMETRRTRLFTQGKYQSSFPLRSFNISKVSPAANIFAFSDELVVIPTNERAEHLATVYLTDGSEVGHVGEPVDFTGVVHEKVIGMNDTHWLRHGDGWISVHKFFPLVTIYDANFGALDQIQLETPLIRRQVDLIMEADPGDRYGMPTPVFSDVKLFRGHLYLMSMGFLHQLDLETHKILSISRFYGTGEDFVGIDAPQLGLYYFAFLDDGSLILGHPALLWNHDLWTASLPYLKDLQN